MLPTDSPTAPPTDPLAGQNYRIRRFSIKLDVDIYDDDGFLLNRGETDPIVITEASFPPPLVEILKSMTSMVRGFVPRPPVDPPPA